MMIHYSVSPVKTFLKKYVLEAKFVTAIPTALSVAPFPERRDPCGKRAILSGQARRSLEPL
jgi:hypothetical protein